MRNLFLVLVLANLGFAAWHSWFAAPALPERPVDSGGPSIALLVNGVAEEIDARGSDQPSLTSAQTCISIGPLPNRVVVAEANKLLGQAGFDAVQRVAQGEVWLGHWVYIDAIETQAEANDIVAELTSSGIDEAYVIAGGNNGNIVSLGVFSVQARADQRLADARNLGYEPVIADRSQPGDVFWLDVTLRNGDSFDLAMLPGLPDADTLRFVSCDATD